MIIYSFDSGYKNLGVCICEYNNLWKTQIDKLVKEQIQILFSKPLICVENIKKLNDLTEKINLVFNSIYKILYINNIDLVPDVKINYKNENLISDSLRNYFDYLKQIAPEPDLVLIEEQMRVNKKSQFISKFIEFYFITLNHGCKFVEKIPTKHKINLPEKKECNVKFIKPYLKNTIFFNESGQHSIFKDIYCNNYVANKNHCKYNFKIYLEMCEYKKSFIDKVTKKADISDAFMQMVAYLIYYY